ncbi:UPF0271 protein [Pustulibacterium marinum]|uniref:UPF0271 protein n=1 Tax=Pustulibacterium marinum TaxID=1224947 RepID=A0A1I7IHZ4_9FLAO|nr:5-oxoprolinase subunit PxpA [Pustulibacterium marinum]SFU72522.1 UPF0271 protein [Pustulibacterium marinum]
MKQQLDLNCDVGEGVNNEASLMPYISSCNISCGAHAGDVATIDSVLQLAVENQVKIGAHPSYPDRANFGRVVMDISPNALKESLLAQLTLFQERLAKIPNATLHHVKAHGALYNASAKNTTIAETIVNVVQKACPDVSLYVPFGSVIATIAKEAGIRISYEIFADRNYQDDLQLVPRSQENAIITHTEDVANHVAKMVLEGNVQTLSGKLIPIQADTCCVHGDNEAAIAIVKELHQLLIQKGIEIV